MAYDFYSSQDSWPVYPAFAGTVVKIEDSVWDGCGRAVWVQSGDFVVSYGHIAPRADLANGSQVDTKRPIGTVFAPRPGHVCTKPHLQVMIYAPEWTVPADGTVEEFSACGKRMGHTATVGIGVTRPASAGTQVTDSGPLNRHMAALEWDGLFRLNVTGRYWRLRERGDWERAPLALEFKMADEFAVLDCAEKGEWRGRWLNENDLLCHDGQLWSCVNDVPGANRADSGEQIGDYYCVEREFTMLRDWVSIPASSPTYHSEAYLDFVMGKRLTKWCKADEASRDWLCCTGAGMAHTCPVQFGQRYPPYTLDGEALVCEVGGASCG